MCTRSLKVNEFLKEEDLSEAAVKHVRRAKLTHNAISLFCYYSEIEQEHQLCTDCLCECHNPASIEELFKDHPALGTLIVSGTKATTYRLNLK